MWFLFLPVGCRRVDYFHILVDFPVFFLLLVSSSILYGWRRYFMWFQLLKCVKTCLVDYMWSVGRIFYVYLRRMYSAAWREMFCICPLSLTGLIVLLKSSVSLLIFHMDIHYLKWNTEVLIIVLLSISSFNSVNIFSTYICVAMLCVYTLHLLKYSLD